MAFTGRSTLISLIDQLVEVGDGARSGADTPRPILVLEGIGGSGRSTVLRGVRDRWAARTPTVAVNPLAVGSHAADSLRPVLVALMLGLTVEVPGYKVSFPRVVLAHIAMAAPIDAHDPELALATMRHRLNTYRNRTAVIDLLGSVVAASGTMVRVPGVEEVAPAVTHAVAQSIVGRLRTAPWVTKLAWHEALDWYGHQDQGFAHDPTRTLIDLSVQSGSDSAAVRRDVDELLVAAFLADLRESFARSVGHPWNAVVLLDNGDARPVVSFLTTLVRVRQTLAAGGNAADPATVITASGGPLTSELEREPSAPSRWDEAQLTDLRSDDVRRSEGWFCVRLGDLTAEDVRHLARAEVWPVDLGTSTVADAVYRLTGGHAAATGLVLRTLQKAPDLVNALDEVLRRPGPEQGGTIEAYLINRIIAGMSRDRAVDPDLRADLITMSAARDKIEAELLRGLLTTPVTSEPELFTSATLWCGAGARGGPALATFLRSLLLRALADRGEDDPSGWQAVFALLRDRAAAQGDLAGKLHHELALGGTTVVAGELAALLPDLPGPQWLELLDQAVATPDLRKPPGAPDEPAGEAGTPVDRHVFRLVAGLQALADARVSNRIALRHTFRLVAHSYRQLADLSPAGLLPLVARAEEHQRRADRLS